MERLRGAAAHCSCLGVSRHADGRLFVRGYAGGAIALLGGKGGQLNLSTSHVSNAFVSGDQVTGGGVYVTSGWLTVTTTDIADALRLTGYFLEHKLAAGQVGKPLPEARARYVDMLRRAAPPSKFDA